MQYNVGENSPLHRDCWLLRLQSTLTGLCSWGNRLEGELMFFSVWRGIGLEMAVWGCIVEVWDNKSGGESHYPWQHMFESEHQILLSLSDSEHSSQCKLSAVFLCCVGAFQSQTHYFRNAGLRSAWNERLSKQTAVFIRNERKNIWCYEEKFLSTQCGWMPFGDFFFFL